MIDTTTETVKRLAQEFHDCDELPATLRALAARVAELEAELMRWRKAAKKGAIYTSAELDAAVAAALEEAINRVSGCDRVSEVQPAIRALIAEYGDKTDD